jgi:hypothetical protein
MTTMLGGHLTHRLPVPRELFPLIFLLSYNLVYTWT